jgi:xanthine dehydrogenase accessory factor
VERRRIAARRLVGPGCAGGVCRPRSTGVPPLGAAAAGRPLALIKGAGDLATGVALRLVRAGYSVVMTETPQPTVVRRKVALADAVYEGRAEVEGLQGVLALEADVSELLARGVVPILVDPGAWAGRRLEPDLVVDAIMAKRNLGTRITDAPLVLALGPGFVAGRDVHAVIETQRGPTLGCVLTHGSAIPDTGIPAERNGFGKERILRAPVEGVFWPVKEIGDRVQRGETVGHVDGAPVVSGLDGIIRGLLRGGLQVTVGFKLGDVDAGATLNDCYTVSDKALAIGGGVLEAACLLGVCAPVGARHIAAL